MATGGTYGEYQKWVRKYGAGVLGRRYGKGKNKKRKFKTTDIKETLNSQIEYTLGTNK